MRSNSHADEQSAKRSSSVTPNVVFEPSHASSASFVSRVVAAERRARAREPALPVVRVGERARLVGVGAASCASARSRSRSVGAASSGHVSAESGRRAVARATSSSSKTAATSSQNGLGSRGAPSSVAASRTR